MTSDAPPSNGHERATRAHWDRESDRYQAGHGTWIAAAPAAWGAWRIPEATLRLLPDVAGKSVLELGCGAGQWAVWLAGGGARVTGLDLSRRQLEHAHRAGAAAGVGLRLLQGSAERLPLAGAAFDVVLSDHGALSWGNPDRTVPEVARVLRPGGVLVCCATSPLFRLCWDDRCDGPGDRLRRDYFGLPPEAEGEGAVVPCTGQPGTAPRPGRRAGPPNADELRSGGRRAGGPAEAGGPRVALAGSAGPRLRERSG